MLNIRHTGIVVTDMDVSIDFYTNLLGFEIKKDQIEKGEYTFLGIKDVEVRTVKMTLINGDMIELLKFHSHTQNNKPSHITNIGCTHFALTVDNIDFLYDKLIAAGRQVINSPTKSLDGKVKVAFCKDPDGTWIELVEEL